MEYRLLTICAACSESSRFTLGGAPPKSDTPMDGREDRMDVMTILGLVRKIYDVAPTVSAACRYIHLTRLIIEMTEALASGKDPPMDIFGDDNQAIVGFDSYAVKAFALTLAKLIWRVVVEREGD